MAGEAGSSEDPIGSAIWRRVALCHFCPPAPGSTRPFAKAHRLREGFPKP